MLTYGKKLRIALGFNSVRDGICLLPHSSVQYVAAAFVSDRRKPRLQSTVIVGRFVLSATIASEPMGAISIHCGLQGMNPLRYLLLSVLVLRKGFSKNGDSRRKKI
jgi:hypothetical protein